MSSKKSKDVSTKEVAKEVSTKKVQKNVVTEKLERDVQVVPIKGFDFSRIMYSEAEVVEIPGGQGKAKRVKINYNYGDGKYGPLNVQPGRKYCFGVQANNIDKDGKILVDDNTKLPKPLTGYKCPLVMSSKEPTEDELESIEFFDNLKLEFQRYAVENKEALGKKSKSDEAVADQVSEVLFRKKENDQIVEGIAPKLYPSLIYFHKNKDMQTVFYNTRDEQVDPLSMTGAFYMEPTIKVESLWIAAKSINPQIKVYDATVEDIQKGPRKRLAPASKVKSPDPEEGGEAEDEAPQSDNE